MKDKVLALLKKQEAYISGEEMSQSLGVTRAAVWKAIKKLQGEGYIIESSTKKGYKLVEKPNVITPAELAPMLCGYTLGQVIKYYEVVDSTNEKAKALAREGASEGTLVIADQQSAGKGRLGRNWSSPAGTGIWMSLILKPEILPQYASQLTLVAGLCMCEAIREVTGLDATIKWPNDIVVNGKKVCGILTEMSAEMERINYIVLGIGVNVNHKAFPEELPFATSLALEGKQDYERASLIKAFLERFEKDYKHYKVDPHLTAILSRYEAHCITLGKTVKIISGNESFTAEAKEITIDGNLIVKTETGEEKLIHSGEVSVRGLYGYI